MKEQIICAGFGGQGIMLLGKIIAQAALKENKQLTWMPSYGAAMRGGCAYCMVMIATERIASPYVDKCDSLFVFNQPSWLKFKNQVKKKGLVFLNSSLIEDNLNYKDIKVLRIPFTEIAFSVGNVHVANMVALGAFLKQKNILKRKSVLEVLSEITPKDKQHLLEINKRALEQGYKIA